MESLNSVLIEIMAIGVIALGLVSWLCMIAVERICRIRYCQECEKIINEFEERWGKK